MEPPPGTASDEVAFFSSRNVDGKTDIHEGLNRRADKVGDVTHEDTIQSFSASRHDASAIPGSSDPFVVGPQQAPYGPNVFDQPLSPAPVLQSTTGQVSNPSSGRPKLSPTQTSDAQLRQVMTYQRKRDTERTPLKSKDTNKDFQLSSSPAQADGHKLPENPSSEPEIIEVIETDCRARGASGSAPSRGRLLPEIVLSSKRSPFARQESPDPLDSFNSIDNAQPKAGFGDQFATSSIPSSAGPSNSPSNGPEDSGRRSGRVKAATEKKEAEKEERRRLRRERRAIEEEEKRRVEVNGGRPNQAQSSSRATPRKREHRVDDDDVPIEIAQSASLTTATPTTASSKKKTPISKRARPSAKKRSRKSTVDDPALDALASESHQSPLVGADEVVAVADTAVQDEHVRHQETDTEVLMETPQLMAETVPVDVDAEELPEPIPKAIAVGKSSQTLRAGNSTSHSEAPSLRAPNPLSPPSRHSPGPQGPSGSASRPSGIRWQTCTYLRSLVCNDHC